MAGIPGGLPAGSLSLTPNFVLWAAICFILLFIAGTIAWLVLHDPLLRLLRRLWLSDLIVAWLLYAALYHLVILKAFRTVEGAPYAVWGLWAALGLYVLLRRLRTPLRRPELLFGLAVLTWAAVIAAGAQYVQETEADAALLAKQPQAVLSTDSPHLRPLLRVLLLTRVDDDTRAATLTAVTMLDGAAPPDPTLLTTFRLERIPQLLTHYQRDLAKLQTYEWMQVALMLLVLLLWGFGQMPPWETL